jgi:hypothetical protein
VRATLLALQEVEMVSHIFRRFGFQQVQEKPNLLLDRVALTRHYDNSSVFGSAIQILPMNPAEVRNVECVQSPLFLPAAHSTGLCHPFHVIPPR